MSIKYKIFLAIFGIFLTTTHVLADCIVTNNNFNKSSKIVFVNQYNGSDQLAKIYSLDNVRNPYEANNVAAFQSVEKAQSHINSDNGDLLLIKAGPQWTNYQAWVGNRLSAFNKEVMKASVMTQEQCQGQSLTWVPSAVNDKQPEQAPVTTDTVSDTSEVTLARSQETATIELPGISANTNSRDSSASLDRSSTGGTTTSGGNRSGGGQNDGATDNTQNSSQGFLNNSTSTSSSNKPGSSPSAILGSSTQTNDNNKIIQKEDDTISTSIDLSYRDICKVSNIGVNLGSVTYFATEMPVIDLARLAYGWTAKSTLELDDNGYIKKLDDQQLPITIISEDSWGRDRLNDRNYVLLYDGEGELEFRYSGAPTIIKKEPGRIELKLNHGMFALVQTSTNPSNYLRNIRIIPAKREFDYWKQITREDYLKKWSNLGVLRFLNTQQINNSKEVEWSDRKKINDFGMKYGLSIAEIIKISNEMHSDPWILVPHLANDRYVENLAKYVKDNLEPGLKVYLEYSNEVWNYSFEQTKSLAKKAKNNSTTTYVEYVQRAKSIFEIWSKYFEKDRLVRVIGTQSVNPWLSDKMLEVPGIADVTDAIAVGFYIGYSLKDEQAELMTENQIIEFLTNDEIARARGYLSEQKSIADKYGVELIAYEAGQHLIAHDNSNESLVEKYTSVNRNPKMEDVYISMYKLWEEIGGGLLVWFQTTAAPNKYGSWGILESMGQDINSAPKYQALKYMINENGC